MSGVPVDPRVFNISIPEVCDHFYVMFSDGRRLTLPLSFYPELKQATNVQCNNWYLIMEGKSVRWPDINFQLSDREMLIPVISKEEWRSILVKELVELSNIIQKKIEDGERNIYI